MEDTTEADPVAGVTLEQYARISKAIATQCLDDEGASRYAQARGITPLAWHAAVDGWNARMREDVVLASRFGHLYEKA